MGRKGKGLYTEGSYASYLKVTIFAGIHFSDYDLIASTKIYCYLYVEIVQG